MTTSPPPPPQTPVQQNLRWGIIGTGWIASMFVRDILAPRPQNDDDDVPVVNHMVTAVGSSSPNGGGLEKAQAFVDAHCNPPPPQNKGEEEKKKIAVYSSYQEVYDSRDVDIVYIATPHSLHKQNCLDAIEAGKHVLCEKPFAINAKDAQVMVDAARHKGVFLMEAMWTRFFPLVIDLQKRIQNGDIGHVRRCFFDFGLGRDWAKVPKSSRSKDPNLGAGALLDIGIYPLTYASLIMGGGGEAGDTKKSPNRVVSSMVIVDGVDESNTAILEYDSADPAMKQTAVTTSTVHFRSPPEFGKIEGTEGNIVVYTELGPSCPTGFRVFTNHDNDKGGKDVRFDHAPGTVGFIHEADAVAADIVSGRTENARMPLDETLRVMRLLDEIRRQNGLVYAQDAA